MTSINRKRMPPERWVVAVYSKGGRAISRRYFDTEEEAIAGYHRACERPRPQPVEVELVRADDEKVA